MLNTSAIKSRMRELGVTQSELAGAVRMATPTICQKLNNIRPTTLEEAEKIAVKLKIADSEFGHYFFTVNLRSAKTGYLVIGKGENP